MEWKSMAISSVLTIVCQKEAMILLLGAILENGANSTDLHRARSDVQNTENDLVDRAQEVAISADRDHVIATGNHPTQVQIRSPSPYRSSRRSRS